MASRGLWPWPDSESPQAYEVMKETYGVVPPTVFDLYSVTRSFAAGQVLLAPLEDAVSWKDKFDELAKECGPGSGFWPSGEILWLNPGLDETVALQVGGEDDGRVFELRWEDGFEWRTLAWSLTDLVACLRDLHEQGWFAWEANPMLRHEHPVDPESLVDSLMPIVDRWNCNPRIAGFVSPYAREPERPTDR